MRIYHAKNLNILKFIISAISIFLFTNCFGQSNSNNTILSNFGNIRTSPQTIRFKNSKKIRNKGGHLQGVQIVNTDTCNYAFLTGSSDTYSYYSIVKLGAKNEVISVNKLMDKPFKHSGGFQIFQNIMAIGIEDNSKKDKSKVCIYDISEPENPPIVPISIIERVGEPMRSTAGCVAITKYKNKALVIVGDWNTEHLDFYSCEFDQLGKMDLEKVYSIDTKIISKKEWIDKNWESYQNINLFTFNNNELYLIGLGQNNKDENIADLFRLKEDNFGNFRLIKLATKTFNCTKKSSFKAGAGVMLNEEGKFQVYSCSYNIEITSWLNYFGNSNN